MDYKTISLWIKSKVLFIIFIIQIVANQNINASSPNEIITFIPSPDSGKIAVRIEIPEESRYPEGAPIVVEVSTWFVKFTGFHRVNDTKRIGAITVSYLWPDREAPEYGVKSDGFYDYGGPLSLKVLRDVIRFASGEIPNIDGRHITELSELPALTDNVGLFASSHSGVVATNVLAYHGSEMPKVRYLVGRENPTRDEMYPLELGYFDDGRHPIFNPFYDEENYSPTELTVDYSTVGWYNEQPGDRGRPYWAAKEGFEQHILHRVICPKLFDKRYYSRALTQALLDNGALSLDNWPEDLATPAETHQYWPYRITVYNYPKFLTQAPNLKVMLVFSKDDHVQAATKKPHIHQAWDGFYHAANLWVRMNPDRAYAHSINPDYYNAFPDNDANKEPPNWIYIRDFAFPAGPGTREDIWLASVAEMADRVQMNNWDVNLDQVFYPVLIDTSATSVEENSHVRPEFFQLFQNYPNPFNSKTAINYQLLADSHVELTVYDLLAKKIELLIDKNQDVGFYTVLFDASKLASGLYFFQLRTGNFCQTKKMALIR
jgi:hypothetical protein